MQAGTAPSRNSTPDPMLLLCHAKTYGLRLTARTKATPPSPQIKARFHQTGWAWAALPHLTLWHTLRCPSLSWHQLWGGVKKQGRRTNVWHYTLLMDAHNYAHVMILLRLIKNWSDWCQKSDSGSVQSLVVKCFFFFWMINENRLAFTPNSSVIEAWWGPKMWKGNEGWIKNLMDSQGYPKPWSRAPFIKWLISRAGG